MSESGIRAPEATRARWATTSGLK